MKKYIFPVVAVGLISSSCVEDKGNYDYKELNEVSIDGIERQYSVLGYIDKLEITPEIEGTLTGTDTDCYEYKWQLCSGRTSTGESQPHQHQVISTQKDLDWTVALEPGAYDLFFTVTDKDTHLETVSSTSINVASAFSKGFMLLGDVDGTDLLGIDMLTMAPGRDTIMVEDVFDNSELRLTGARKLFFSGYYYKEPAQTMWLMTETDAYHMTSNQEFKITNTFDKAGICDSEIDIKRPMRVRNTFPGKANTPYYSRLNMSKNFRGYITEDAVFAGDIMLSEYFGTPLNRYSASSTNLFNVYPEGFWNTTAYSIYSFNASFVLYDTDNDRFVRLLATSKYCNPLTGASTDAWSFDLKSQNRKMIYGENTYAATRGWCCFVVNDYKDNSYYIYRLSIPTGAYDTSPLYTTYKELYKIQSAATDFDKASMYAFPAYGTRMFYAVGSKLYIYDYSRNQIDSKDLGAEIVMLKTDISAGRNTDVLVATWDPSTKGKVYKFQHGTNANVAEMKVRNDNGYDEEWSTRLKIKDIDWYSMY